MLKRFLSALGGAALVAVLAFSPAQAAYGPPEGRGGGGETETLGNNLSVPAVFVGSTSTAPALRIACATAGLTGQAPGVDGVASSTTFPGYWLQKTEATWSASCATATSTAVTAAWGANLTDSPRLAAGQPIRVEMGLLDTAATNRTGYTVVKLTDEIDRLATYGTDGTSFMTGSDPATSVVTHVWVAGAGLKIERLTAGTPDSGTWTPVYTAPATAEINSTGAVVYGYNWGSKGKKNTPTAGTYRLTFSVPTGLATITGVVPGATNQPTVSGDSLSTSLVITLNASHGGGGAGGH